MRRHDADAVTVRPIAAQGWYAVVGNEEAWPSHRVTISTVIFDLDGLLSDTERLHCDAWRHTISTL